MDVWKVILVPCTLQNSQFRGAWSPVILEVAFYVRILARCMIDTVTFQSKNEHLEVGNMDGYYVIRYFRVEDTATNVMQEMVFKYFLRDCFSTPI